MRAHMGILALAVFLLISRAHPDTLSMLQEKLTRLDKQLNNLCFIYESSYIVDWTDNKYPRVERAFIIDLCRSDNGLTRIAFRSKQGTDVKKLAQELGTSVDQLAKLPDTSYWQWWCGNGWTALYERALGRTIKVLNIVPCTTNGIYCDGYRFPTDYNIYRFDPLILGNFNLISERNTDVRWRIAQEDEKSWVLLGEYQAPAGQRGTVRVVLLKPEAQLQSVEMVETLRHAGQERVMIRKQWVVKAWQTFKGLKLPQRIETEVRKSYATIKSVVQLLQVRPLPRPLSLDFPLGTNVSDYRLLEYKDFMKAINLSDVKDKVVRYDWTGRLYSPEELRQLAYQQGNLVPPSSPRRRYTPWLLLPAVLLFLAAGYLYFRNRRKPSA